jgi:glutathione S-transferase
MWMRWQASDFNNSWRVASKGVVRKNPDHQDPSAIARSVADFSRMVAVVDRELAKSGGFICGPDLRSPISRSGLSIHRWRLLPAEKPRLGNIDRYYNRLCERAAFRQYGRDGGL